MVLGVHEAAIFGLKTLCMLGEKWLSRTKRGAALFIVFTQIVVRHSLSGEDCRATIRLK